MVTCVVRFFEGNDEKEDILKAAAVAVTTGCDWWFNDILLPGISGSIFSLTLNFN